MANSIDRAAGLAKESLIGEQCGIVGHAKHPELNMGCTSGRILSDLRGDRTAPDSARDSKPSLFLKVA